MSLVTTYKNTEAIQWKPEMAKFRHTCFISFTVALPIGSFSYIMYIYFQFLCSYLLDTSLLDVPYHLVSWNVEGFFVNSLLSSISAPPPKKIIQLLLVRPIILRNRKMLCYPLNKVLMTFWWAKFTILNKANQMRYHSVPAIQVLFLLFVQYSNIHPLKDIQYCEYLNYQIVTVYTKRKYKQFSKMGVIITQLWWRLSVGSTHHQCLVATSVLTTSLHYGTVIEETPLQVNWPMIV